MLKNLFKGVLKMLNKLKNLFLGSHKKSKSILVENKNAESKHLTSKEKDHVARLERFQLKELKKRTKLLPIITNKSYHRSYERLQAIKEHKLYLRELKLQGKGLNDKGEVINKQQPYRKDQYKSLEAYNRYARGFNYNNR